MTIEYRRDTDIVTGPSIEDVRQDTAAVKKQYMDAQQRRTIDAAVGEVMAAIKAVEVRCDALEADMEQARHDQQLEALRAHLSRPVLAYELDDTASMRRSASTFRGFPND